MNLKFSKYEGTGNDFIIIDNREKIFDPANASLINKLCSRRFGIGADGLLLLNRSENYDYNMEYFNSDGNLGSMCGNGGRCLAAFAKRLGIIKTKASFDAVDGIHQAEIKKYDEKKLNAVVSLKMADVKNPEETAGLIFMNTGSPHIIKFVDDVNEVDVITEGRKIRHSKRFREKGTNVNFISFKNDLIYMRTYERGVEDETLSCGTGAVAAALAVADKDLLKDKRYSKLITKGGELIVHFEKAENGFKNIFLEGPATFVFDAEIEV